MLVGLSIDETRFPDTDWPGYAIHISDPIEIGRVLDILSQYSDGVVVVTITGDMEGNTVYTLSGVVDDLDMIEEVHRRCVDLGIRALFSY